MQFRVNFVQYFISTHCKLFSMYNYKKTKDIFKLNFKILIQRNDTDMINLILESSESEFDTSPANIIRTLKRNSFKLKFDVVDVKPFNMVKGLPVQG